MTDPHRDPVRVASARRGIAQARATLDVRFPIVWDRDAKVYRVACFDGDVHGLTFEKWSDASEWVLAQPIEGEA